MTKHNRIKTKTPKASPRAPWPRPENTIHEWTTENLTWAIGETYYQSIIFTWELEEARQRVRQFSPYYSRFVVGGPAVQIRPDAFNDFPNVKTSPSYPGVLQRANPDATRTSTGCNNKCKFCATGQGLIEPGGLVELADWPDLPVLADNNILQCSTAHFDRVIERLQKFPHADFAQGLDVRRLTQHHAHALATLNTHRICIVCDAPETLTAWDRAHNYLLDAGIPAHKFTCYCLIGHTTGPEEAWDRCSYIANQDVRVGPLWFHDLGTPNLNHVTPEQEKLGWTHRRRVDIQAFFFRFKKPPGGFEFENPTLTKLVQPKNNTLPAAKIST